MSVNPYVCFGFPFKFERGKTCTVGGTARSVPSFVEIETSINTGIRQILLTEPRERVMTCNFGVGVSKYLFSALGSSFQGLLQYEVKDQLQIWEPRVILSSLKSSLSVQRSSLHMGLKLDLTEFEGVTSLSVSVGY